MCDEKGTGGLRIGGNAAWRSLIPPLMVFGAALGVRLAYLYQVRTVPFFEYPVVDARSYDAWAQRILAGDWWGGEVFYQAPAYPYFLAVVYRLSGHGLWGARVAQAVLGALSCVWLLLAGRRFFGWSAGVVAGALLAVYPPAIFFDGLIQKAGLDLFLMTLLLYSLARAQENPRGRAFALSGLITGLLALTRENTLILAAVIPLWVILRFADRSRRDRAGLTAAFLGGVAVVLLPVGVRNYSVGQTFSLTTSQMGTNFYIGNNPRATGMYDSLVPGQHDPAHERRDAVTLAERALGRRLKPGEVSDFWFRRAMGFVRENPGRWLRLLAYKLMLTWNRVEIPDTEDIHIYAEWSSLLRGLGTVMHFGVLVPLAAAGVVLSWQRRGKLWILYVLVAAITGSVALFYVFGRYRYPLVPVLIPLAGAACAEAAVLLQRREFGRLAAPAVAAVAMAAAVNWPVVSSEEFLAASRINLGLIYADTGREEQAERCYLVAAGIDPENSYPPYCLGELRVRQGRFTEAESFFGKAIALSPQDGKAHAGLADALALQGRFDQALAEYRAALAHNPDFIRAQAGIVRVQVTTGAMPPEEAITRYEEFIAREPENAVFLKQSAVLLRDAGRPSEAERRLRESLSLAPNRAVTHNELGVVLGRLGRIDEAMASFGEALRLDPRLALAHRNLALTLAMKRRPAEAVESCRRAVEIEPADPESHLHLARLLAGVGQRAEAAAEYRETLRLRPEHAAARQELDRLIGRQ